MFEIFRKKINLYWFLEIDIEKNKFVVRICTFKCRCGGLLCLLVLPRLCVGITFMFDLVYL